MTRSVVESESSCQLKVKDGPVIVVSESIVEDSVDFMNPQTNQFVRLSHSLGRHQQNTAHDARKVAQVEDVVALARSR